MRVIFTVDDFLVRAIVVDNISVLIRKVDVDIDLLECVIGGGGGHRRGSVA